MREDYTTPVGFASEPSERRKSWKARIVTAALLVFIVWLAWTKVINPPDDQGIRPPTQQSELPGPR
jgi:hypothetical protein